MAETAGQRELHTFSLIKNLIDWLDADVPFTAEQGFPLTESL